MQNFCKTAVVLSLFNVPLLFANPVDESVNVIEKTNTQLKSYQQNIDSNEEKREDLLSEYKYTNSNLKSTKNYNDQLSKLIESQKDEMTALDTQLEDIEQTKKNIFPLMENMVKSLRTLVEQDMPFLMTERLSRVERLEETLNRADIQTHEKYRIILEAFKIEYDYAKSIESYQAELDGKTYNFLRLGRTALYYQSLDLKDYGYYNKQSKTWKIISDMTSKSNIRKGIKIANKQQNVDLLNLPFLASKGSK